MTEPLDHARDFDINAVQETRLVVQALKIERLEEKQEELRERLKVVEKWVIGAAAVLAAGVTVIGIATNISVSGVIHAGGSVSVS